MEPKEGARVFAVPEGLSPTEEQLLAALRSRPGEVLSRGELLEMMHGTGGGNVQEHAVDATVSRLRKALGPGGACIETVRRKGFRWNPDRVEVDPATGNVWVGGNPVELIPCEAALMSRLASRPGRTLSREELAGGGGRKGEPPSRAADEIVSSLRRKLGAAGRCIATDRGRGYRFVPDGPEPGRKASAARRAVLALFLVAAVSAGWLFRSGGRDPVQRNPETAPHSGIKAESVPPTPVVAASELLCTVQSDLHEILFYLAEAKRETATGRWGVVALRYKEAIEAGNTALSHVRPWNEEYASAYAEILAAILSATNRLDNPPVETGTNAYETVRSVFGSLPPRQAEEPNQAETWACSAHDLKRELAWIPRERDWVTNYVATAGDRFRFAAIRDRLEGHLARAEEIRDAASRIRDLFDRANAEHYALCTNRVEVECAAAANQPDIGRINTLPLKKLDDMMAPLDKDGRFDECLSRLEDVWKEYWRARIESHARYDFEHAVGSVGGYRTDVLKIRNGKSFDLAKPEDAREYAGLALECARWFHPRGLSWFEALQILRSARAAIVPHLPEGDGEPTETQRAMEALLGDIDETERKWIAERFEIDCGEALREIESGQAIRARRPLNRLAPLVELFNHDGRYDDLLSRIDETMEKTRQAEEAAREARKQRAAFP